MTTRRAFLAAAGASLTVGPLTSLTPAQLAPGGRKRLAVVTTEWRYGSHAWHMAERFLVGYPIKGEWHQPPFDVVAA